MAEERIQALQSLKHGLQLIQGKVLKQEEKMGFLLCLGAVLHVCKELYPDPRAFNAIDAEYQSAMSATLIPAGT